MSWHGLARICVHLQCANLCAWVAAPSCPCVCRQDVMDKLFRQSKSTGRLKLESKKPVVLVLGTGWGAHSLVKVCLKQVAAACSAWRMPGAPMMAHAGAQLEPAVCMRAH